MRNVFAYRAGLFASRQGTLLCLAAALSLAGCGGTTTPKTEPLPEVTILRPSHEPVTDYLEFTGNAQASEVVQLQARVSGFLTNVTFKDGDLVKQGDLLFEIEPETYKAKETLAQASLKAAQAESQRAEYDFIRMDNLVKKNAVSVSEADKARAQRDIAAARVEQTKSELELTKIQVGYTRVYAPFEGRLDRRLKDPGNLVGAGEPTLLTTIYKMDPIYAYFSINEKDLVRVRKATHGQVAQQAQIFAAIEGDDGYPHQGVIDFGSSSLDPTTGTLLLRGVFDNPPLGKMPKIVPGMFVRLRVPISRRDRAVLVPEQALGIDQGGRFILVVGDQDLVDKKPVKTGAQVRDLRVIEEGLTGDERVIVVGMQQARPGTKVKPVQKEATDKLVSARAPMTDPTEREHRHVLQVLY